MVRLHYFFDPMCGWCYGAASLIEALDLLDNIEVVFYPAGMLNKQEISATFRHHIVESDKRIAKLTGATFGQAYLDRMLGKETVVLDSLLPIKAFLTGVSLGAKPTLLLKSIQAAHYQEGVDFNEQAAWSGIADKLGLNRDKWRSLMQVADNQLQATLIKNANLMSEKQVSGYPTFFLEKEGQWVKIAHTQYYGKSDAWLNDIRRLCA